MSVVRKLFKAGQFTPPKDKEFFVPETSYEVIMGSMAYGVSNDMSDMDVYAMVVPPKSWVFPHLDGHVPGFGPPPKTFDTYQKHHMVMDERNYDVQVYSIVKYFQLCAENNPNMVDSLFVPDRCVLYADDVGKHMRANRKLFLSKLVYQKFKGYAYSEMKKLRNKAPVGERAKMVEKYGMDVKHAYHIVRLACEAEQILQHGDLDLEANREQLKSIRRGEIGRASCRERVYCEV